MNPLYSFPKNIETRWASPENPHGARGAAAQSHQGRKGRPCLPLAAGEQVVLAHAPNICGIVHRIWLTVSDRSPAMLRSLRLDIFWDGAATPAVSAPVADFFGQGLGRCQVFESVFFSNPEGRSFNCILPMPFQKGFRILLTNESATNLDMLFYDVNYTLGDHMEEPMYLHACWRRENPTTMLQDYVVLPKIEGRGRYLGANFGVIVDSKNYPNTWWGEGECKIFLDGDTTSPTLAGTGTEDYIGTAWGQGQYAHLHQGCHLADAANGQYAFYRYHAPDPVYFHRDIRVTFQQIGWCDGKALKHFRETGRQLAGSGTSAGKPINMEPPENPSNIFERADDWSSCSYFYLDRPESNLPPLAPLSTRTTGLLATNTTATVGVA